MARLHFLGTGAALPSADRSNTALALLGEDAGRGLLIDCGGDIYRELCRAHLERDVISDLFITHAHIDHIGSLPSLIESYRLGGRTRPLTIHAIPEVLAIARRIVEDFSHELTLDSWTYEVRFVEARPGQTLHLGEFTARLWRMDHTVPSVGLRFELPSGILAYTCDTQPNPHIVELAGGAQTLITECTYLQAAVESARLAKHLTAREAGEQAASCGARRLAIVHIGDAEGWSPEAARAEIAAVFSGEILIPHDGDTLDV